MHGVQQLKNAMQRVIPAPFTLLHFFHHSFHSLREWKNDWKGNERSHCAWMKQLNDWTERKEWIVDWSAVIAFAMFQTTSLHFFSFVVFHSLRFRFNWFQQFHSQRRKRCFHFIAGIQFHLLIETVAHPFTPQFFLPFPQSINWLFPERMGVKGSK